MALPIRYLCGVALISLLVSTLHVEDEPKKEYTIKWKIVFVLDNNWLSLELVMTCYIVHKNELWVH